MIKPLIITTLLLLVGCSSPTLDDYQQMQPQFTLETFFDGKLTAYGMVFNRSGKLTRRFTAQMDASWQGEQGIIDEWFEFDDGETSRRTWTLTRLANNQYEGTAGDVIGKAQGAVSGAAFYWRYQLLLPVGKKTYQVTLDDWMYLMDENRLFNRTEIIKFGVRVGEVVIFIEKQPPDTPR